jgi:hypothetical protein
LGSSRLRVGKQLEKSAAAGAVLITDATAEPSYLGIGTAGQVLTTVAGAPAWAAAAATETITTITGASATGHTIGTYNNEAATAVVLREAITVLGTPTLSGANILSIPFTDETGTLATRTVDLSTLAVDINVATVAFNAATGVLTLTETDATVHTVTISSTSTNTLTNPVNTITSTVNGVVATAPAVNTNTLTAASASTITSTVNGVAATLVPPVGVIASTIGFNAAGAMVKAVTTYVDEFFDPAAAATTVTLSATPIAGHPVEIHRNGVKQRIGAGNDYTISGTTVTFTPAFGISGGGATATETVNAIYQS